jgi:hypothetical protein
MKTGLTVKTVKNLKTGLMIKRTLKTGLTAKLPGMGISWNTTGGSDSMAFHRNCTALVSTAC